MDSMSPARMLARQIVDLRRRMPSVEVAMVTSADPLQVDGVALKTLGWYNPRVGDAVLVIRRGNAAYSLGPLVANQDVMPPTVLTVQTVSPQTATVAADDGTSWTLPYVGAAPGSGQQVAILWQRRGHLSFEGLILGPIGATPPLVTVETTPGKIPATSAMPADPVIAPNPLVLSAVDMATWRNGMWRPDTTAAYQGTDSAGQANAGLFFYGVPPTGLSVISAEVYQHRCPGVGPSTAVTARWYRHSATTRPSTLPALTDAFDGLAQVPGAAGWAPIPLAIAQSIATNGGGLAVSSSATADYCSLSPRDSVDPAKRDPQSGAIRFTWRP